MYEILVSMNARECERGHRAHAENTQTFEKEREREKDSTAITCFFKTNEKKEEEEKVLIKLANR